MQSTVQAPGSPAASHAPCRVSTVRWVLLFSFERGGNRQRDVSVSPITSHCWQVAEPLGLMPPLRRGRGALRREGSRTRMEGESKATALPVSGRGCSGQRPKVGLPDQIAGLRQELCYQQGESPGSPGVWASGSVIMSTGSSFQPILFRGH